MQVAFSPKWKVAYRAAFDASGAGEHEFESLTRLGRNGTLHGYGFAAQHNLSKRRVYLTRRYRDRGNKKKRYQLRSKSICIGIGPVPRMCPCWPGEQKKSTHGTGQPRPS
jgi:hypothetical protein